jgi:hypothetical protein
MILRHIQRDQLYVVCVQPGQRRPPGAAEDWLPAQKLAKIEPSLVHKRLIRRNGCHG